MRLKERSIAVLWNVSNLLRDSKRWSAFTLAEDVNGCPVTPGDSSAVKWSLVGALTRYETTILAINALIVVSGCDLKTLEIRATHAELLRILERGMTWLEAWHEHTAR